MNNFDMFDGPTNELPCCMNRNYLDGRDVVGEIEMGFRIAEARKASSGGRNDCVERNQ